MHTEVSLAAGADTAPALDISITGVEPVEFAAVPTLRFSARITTAAADPVRFIALCTQIRIAARQRHYPADERERLRDLFGTPDQWGRNLHSLLWTHATTQVAAFTGDTVADILVPCTYDFDVASAKYLHGLSGGDVPLEFLFSGTVFYTADGVLQVAQIPHSTEAGYRMPAKVWRRLMEHYFPHSAWLRLDRDTFDRLHAYKARHTLATWSETVESLLSEAEPAAGDR